MTDTSFGGGLSLGSGDAGIPPDAAPAPAPSPSVAQPQGFGGGLGIMGGPRYTPPDPNASPLDQTADMLQQRIKRANEIGSNPIAQFFNPEATQAARAFVPQATEQLQKIRQQKADMAANRQQAETLGLHPGEVPDEATQADRVEVARARALKGDLKVFKGLQAVDPKIAEEIAPQVHEVVAGHLSNAQAAFDKLSNMRSQGEYTAAIKSLRQDGTLTQLEGLGLKVPEKWDAFLAAKPIEGQALREARIGVENVRQKLEDRNTYIPMEEKEAKTYAGRIKTVYGDEIPGTWSRNGASGTRGLVVPGMADPRTVGPLATPEQRKGLKEDFAAAVSKEDMEKYRAFNRTYDLATKDAKGKMMPEGKLNTNPNVQQGVSEGLASMLRGGQGGANVGLLKIELAKRGWAQGAIDSLVSNYAGTINTLFKDADKPYLTERTQKQIRDVMDVLKTYNDTSISDRTADLAKRAGALRLDSSVFGFTKGESAGAVDAAIKEGRDAQIATDMQRHQSIGGGDGVLQIGAQRPGAGAAPLPPGTTATNQQPGGDRVATPVQQAVAPGSSPAPGVGPTGPQPPAPAPAAGGGPNAQGSGGPMPVAPTGGPTPGRYGLPPGMLLNTPQALDAAANRTIQIESGFKPGQQTGSYKGYGQWSDAEMKRHGITNPNDLEQTRAALKADIQDRAAKLQKARLPVTASNVYLMHQQGEAGLEAHLKNPDGKAWENIAQFYKSPAIAKQAVWGNMTPEMKRQFPGGVDSVTSGDFTKLWEARYDGTDNTGSGNIASAAGRRSGLAASGRTAPRAEPQTNATSGGLRAWLMGGEPSATNPQETFSPENMRQMTENAATVAPAALSTVGGVFGGPVGGGIGGAAGSAAQDYLRGRPIDKAKMAEEGALGAVLGVGSVARPFLAAGVRTLGAGGVEAGTEALKGGSAQDVTEKGLTGAGEAAGGEAFGRALGMGLHKAWSWLGGEGKAAFQKAAQAYHEATTALEKTEPKIAGAGGVSSANPAYVAAEQARDAAEKQIKDIMPNAKPEEVAYAHKVTSEGVPKGEAEVSRPGTLEKERLGAGYKQIESDVGDKGVGAPKASPKLPDGPRAAVEAGKVPKAFGELATQVEAKITAPAPNWQTKWVQLKDARSELLEQERAAISSTGDRKVETANAYRALADTVRAQQEKVATHVFGADGGKQVISRLNMLDTRYRRLMEATNGGDIAAAATLKGEKGRAADAAFRAFAHDDPQALAAWNAMRSQRNNVEKDVLQVISAEKIPVLGKLISGAKLLSGFRDFMRERAAGSPVTFADMVPELKAASQRTARAFRDVGGAAGSRAAVMQ